MYLPALLLLCAVGLVSADDKPCTLHHKGNYYDLNPLTSKGKDYEWKTPADHLVVLNVCRSPVRETFGLNDVDSPDIGGFMRHDHRDFSFGALNTTITIEDSRPRITMTKGSRCKSESGSSTIRASSVIEFVCDTSVSGSGKPRFVAQLPPGNDENACAFFFEWRTSAACPKSEPGGVLGFLWSLIMTVMGLALLYLAAGTVYNRYVLQLRGVDQIPQFSLESMRYHASEALDWLKDLAGGMRSGGAYNRTSSGSYHSHSTLPTHRTPASSGISPVSHQAQVQVPNLQDQGSPANSGGFVRPTRVTPTTGRINPVSHQAQVSSPSTPPLPSTLNQTSPPPPPPKNIKPRPPPMDLQGTAEEREFLVGEDEGDGDIGSAATTSQAPSQAGGVAPEPRRGSTGSTEDTVATRDSDNGPDGAIRL